MTNSAASSGRGKDSIAAWLKLRRFFRRVIPVHMYMHPDLEFEEESLAYYERVFGAHVYRMPSPSIYRLLRYAVFQPPPHLPIIEGMELPEFDYDDLFNIVKLAEGLPLETFTAVGVTQNDNLNRRASIVRSGAVNMTRRQFFPIFDYTKPKDYHLWGRSFDGLDYRFIAGLKEHAPHDYQKLCDLYGMLDLEILRYEWREKHFFAQGGANAVELAQDDGLTLDPDEGGWDG